MSLTVTWDQSGKYPDQTVIFWTFTDDWDWNDFMQASQQAYDLATSVSHTVDSIIDLRFNRRIPRTGALAFFGRAITHAPPNRGVVLLVQPGVVLRTLEGMLRRIYPAFSHQYVTVDSVDEAYQRIAEYRAERQSAAI